MRPAPFFVSGPVPVPVPVHCTGAGRSSGSGTVRLLRFGFRARFRSSLPLSRRSRLSRASGPPVPRPSPLPGAAPVPRPSFRGRSAGAPRPGESVPVPARTKNDKESFCGAFDEWYEKYRNVVNEHVHDKRIKRITPPYMPSETTQRISEHKTRHDFALDIL